jgi:TetR/AcrR family transcriptional repressor of nem operon
MNMFAVPRRRGRPPKALAGYSQTRESLVRAGVVALTEKGFSATGIEEILQSVGVPKGSFYHYFESKEVFGAELIKSYAEYFARRLDHFFLNEERTPIDRLKDFTADAERGMRRYAFTRGCLVGNLGQEMGALPEAYRDQLTGIFADWQLRTARCLMAAQKSGQIGKHLDCDQFAAFFWIGWEGAVLRAKLERNPLPLRTFAAGFFAAVEN